MKEIDGQISNLINCTNGNTSLSNACLSLRVNINVFDVLQLKDQSKSYGLNWLQFSNIVA